MARVVRSLPGVLKLVFSHRSSRVRTACCLSSACVRARFSVCPEVLPPPLRGLAVGRLTELALLDGAVRSAPTSPCCLLVWSESLNNLVPGRLIISDSRKASRTSHIMDYLKCNDESKARRNHILLVYNLLNLGKTGFWCLTCSTLQILIRMQSWFRRMFYSPFIFYFRKIYISYRSHKLCLFESISSNSNS